MSNIYSTLFYAQQEQIGEYEQAFLVPEGFVYVLRDITIYSGVTGGTIIYVRGNENQVIAELTTLLIATGYLHLEGRWVFGPRQECYLEVQEGNADVTLCGYRLETV